MIRLTFLLLFVIGSLARAQEDFGGKEIVAAQDPEKPSYFIADTPYGEFIMRVQSPIVHLPKSGTIDITNFLAFGLRKDGENIEQTGGFFDVKPKPIKARVGESSGYTTTTVSDNLQFHFTKPGPVQLVAILGTEIVTAQIEVKQLPFETGMNSDVVIEELGFPTTKTTHYVKWPENEFVDGIFYSVSASESIISVEHWTYEQLPYCIFAIEGNKIRGIHSICVDPTDKIRFPEAYRKMVLEQMSKILEEPEPQKQPEEVPKEEKLTDFRVWTDRKGKTVEARFIRYFDSKVTLETPAKRRIDIRINQLIDSDAQLARKFNAELKGKKNK